MQIKIFEWFEPMCFFCLFFFRGNSQTSFGAVLIALLYCVILQIVCISNKHIRKVSDFEGAGVCLALFPSVLVTVS